MFSVLKKEKVKEVSKKEVFIHTTQLRQMWLWPRVTLLKMFTVVQMSPMVSFSLSLCVCAWRLTTNSSMRIPVQKNAYLFMFILVLQQKNNSKNFVLLEVESLKNNSVPNVCVFDCSHSQSIKLLVVRQDWISNTSW